MAFIGLNEVNAELLQHEFKNKFTNPVSIHLFLLFLYRHLSACVFRPIKGRNGSMFSSKIEIRSESIMKDYLYHDMGHMSQIRKVISVCFFVHL